MKIYSVIFKENGKNYYFNGEEGLKVDDYVIVETDNGLQYGKINNIIDNKGTIDLYKNIVRVASKEDEEEYYKLLKEAKKALIKCKEIVSDMNLNMNIISANYTYEKAQLIFCFVSDERVDFRELAKKLASIYHTRIELRQIGARDKAKEIGGVGVCGQKICCSRFLNHIDAISMNMAKNQNLALTPSKINGICGRLLCCLQYEDENYQECNKWLPSINDIVQTKNGEGKVINVNSLNKKYTVLIGNTKEEIEIGKDNEGSTK